MQFVRHPHALTLFEDTVYWSDRRENRVSQCNKFNCDNQTVVRSRVWGPLGITVVHPARQPQGLNLLYRSFIKDLIKFIITVTENNVHI